MSRISKSIETESRLCLPGTEDRQNWEMGKNGIPSGMIKRTIIR